MKVLDGLPIHSRSARSMRMRANDQEQVSMLGREIYSAVSILTHLRSFALFNSYKFSHLAYIRQALSYSTKTSLRTDSSGILSMQFMIMNTAAAGSGGGKNEATGAGFVEFTVSIFCHS